MSVLSFRKEKNIDRNLKVTNDLREIRTKMKQLKLREKELIDHLDKHVASDNFVYDVNHNPIAKLTISTTTSFDTVLFIKEHLDIYEQYPRLSTRKTWRTL